MNLKLSITTALIALTTFPAFAKMERLGINQPAPGYDRGRGAWLFHARRSILRSAPVARGPQKRKELSAVLSMEVRREVENNTGLGEAGAIDPTSKATIRGGKTYEEAIKHAEETLTLYLESYDELGKSIPEERGLQQPASG